MDESTPFRHSCNNCRQAHKGCDRQGPPCGRCINFGIESSCAFKQRSGTPFPKGRKPTAPLLSVKKDARASNDNDEKLDPVESAKTLPKSMDNDASTQPHHCKLNSNLSNGSYTILPKEIHTMMPIYTPDTDPATLESIEKEAIVSETFK
jgi:hypothetical protein